jgi:hypothetical protein
MSTQSESSKKARLERPADYYKSPEDITHDSELSPDEKRQERGAPPGSRR